MDDDELEFELKFEFEFEFEFEFNDEDVFEEMGLEDLRGLPRFLGRLPASRSSERNSGLMAS